MCHSSPRKVYFLEDRTEPPGVAAPFTLSSEQRRGLTELLRGHELPLSPDALVRFLGEAIEAREYGKFVYSRGVSELLRQFGAFASRLGFSLEDCSYADVTVLQEAVADGEVRDRLARSIAAGRAAFPESGLVLPPLLLAVEDVWSFHLPRYQPNFITRGCALGPVRAIESAREAGSAGASPSLAGCVLLLPCADPGYDWIFTMGIVAFVTMFGGANSHMAIRARELNIPAAVGVGEPLFRRLRQARALRVDCLNRQVVIIQ